MALDARATRTGVAMLLGGILLCVAGALMMYYAQGHDWMYDHYRQYDHAALLLIGLGVLAGLVGLMNLHGGLREDEVEGAGPAPAS